MKNRLKTFYLNESSEESEESEEVVFEVYPDGSAEKIWPYLAITDLNENDLIEWLKEDIEKGFNSRIVEVEVEFE